MGKWETAGLPCAKDSERMGGVCIFKDSCQRQEIWGGCPWGNRRVLEVGGAPKVLNGLGGVGAGKSWWWVVFEGVDLQRESEEIRGKGLKGRGFLCWGDLGPGVGFSRNFRAPEEAQVVSELETSGLVFGGFQEGKRPLGETSRGGLWELGGSNTNLAESRSGVLKGPGTCRWENEV